ncbi:MAG: hypothetical protein ACYC1L_06295 [Alphaproteobacteria bacterium]
MVRFAAALLALSVFAAPVAARTAWVPYVSGDGRFEAAFPGEPKIADVADASGRRKLDLIVELADDEAYLVSVSYFPPGTEAGVPAARVLEKIEDSSRQGFPNSTLLGSKPVALGRWQGRELAMRNDKGLLYRARLFWVGTTLYQVVTIVGETRAAQAPVRQFLDSFKILKE